ncbi:MAG: serine protein kinase RIO [Nitrososphaerales archaeon]|nr:serine protein kinase RIO [Nitrososphaerales archaeon]
MEEGEDESRKVEDRMFRSERENRYLRKDSDQRKVMEEVFDRQTLLAVEELVKRRQLRDLHGVVAAGKESRVYYGVNPAGTPVAVKIYLTASMEFKKRMAYIAGDRRFGRLPAGSREIINLWVQKEFKNLQLADSVGVRVPKPTGFYRNILVMEFIGEPPRAAPTFVETEVDRDDYDWTLASVSKLYKAAKLVHADLSEFNIFKWGKERLLFDMGSAVLASHPRAREFLLRDLFNVVRFFRRRGIFEDEADVLLKRLTE